MSKILILPSTIEQIYNISDRVDGFIIGIDNMAVNTPLNIELKDVSKIRSVIDKKDVFISLNKNIENNDLAYLKQILIELDNYNIKGVLFYDVAVLNIYNSLKLKYDLVCSQEHLTTNYDTVNYWYDLNCKYTYLSSDITEEEIIEITNNTKSKLMVNLFGYLPMFVSKRHIVNNYLNNFKLTDNSNINYMEKENKVYPIIDNNLGTCVYSNNILNGISSYLNINVDYVVLNSFNIEEDRLLSIIELFRTVSKTNIETYKAKIKDMFENVDDGFLHNKTIYRVKKNDK